MHVLGRSWNQDPRIGSDVDRDDRTSMEERIGDVVHGTSPEPKTLGVGAQKSLIFCGSDLRRELKGSGSPD